MCTNTCRSHCSAHPQHTYTPSQHAAYGTLPGTRFFSWLYPTNGVGDREGTMFYPKTCQPHVCAIFLSFFLSYAVWMITFFIWVCPICGGIDISNMTPFLGSLGTDIIEMSLLICFLWMISFNFWMISYNNGTVISRMWSLVAYMWSFVFFKDCSQIMNDWSRFSVCLWQVLRVCASF